MADVQKVYGRPTQVGRFLHDCSDRSGDRGVFDNQRWRLLTPTKIRPHKHQRESISLQDLVQSVEKSLIPTNADGSATVTHRYRAARLALLQPRGGRGAGPEPSGVGRHLQATVGTVQHAIA